jgi:hypothetical protein
VRVEVIETLPAFNRLEENWNAVYDTDPDAQFFLSWKWLSGWLGQISSPWFILGVKADRAADAPYVAFLERPARDHGSWRRRRPRYSRRALQFSSSRWHERKGFRSG